MDGVASFITGVREGQESLRAFSPQYIGSECQRLCLIASSTQGGYKLFIDLFAALALLCCPPERGIETGHDAAHIDT